MSWPEPLILASSSPRRRELLAAAGIEAISVSPEIDDNQREAFERKVANYFYSPKKILKKNKVNKYQKMRIKFQSINQLIKA